MEVAIVCFCTAALGGAFLVGFGVSEMLAFRAAERMRDANYEKTLQYSTQLGRARAKAKQLLEELSK